MVRSLNDADSEVRANVAEALGILCDGHAGNKNRIREAGGIAAMIQLLSDADAKVCANSARVLGILCDGHAAVKVAIGKAGGIAAMVRFLNDTFSEVRVKVAKEYCIYTMIMKATRMSTEKLIRELN